MSGKSSVTMFASSPDSGFRAGPAYVLGLGAACLAGGAIILKAGLIYADYGARDFDAGLAGLFLASAYLLDLLVTAGVIVGIGYAATGRVFGILLGGFNDFSLARLQLLIWLTAVLPAILVAATFNLLLGHEAAPDPLGIALPAPLVFALGIALFTAAAAPALLAFKSGRVVGHETPDEASWLDVVSGDERADAGAVDLSKLQLLLATLLLAGLYALATIALLLGHAGAALAALPALSPSLVGLLAFSHAGYLVYKALPRAGLAGAMPVTPRRTARAERRAGEHAGGFEAPVSGLAQVYTEAASVAEAAAVAPPAPPALSSVDIVPVRVAIADAASVVGLSFTVDGEVEGLDEEGFATVPLTTGVPHRLEASGLREGARVTGTTTLVLTQGDRDLPVALMLA